MRDRKQCLHTVAGGRCALSRGAMLSGCGWEDSAAVDEAEPIELRSYEVPQEHQENLRDMLHTVLGAQGNNDARIGRVFNGPGGTLLVAAPARIQSGNRTGLDRGLRLDPGVTSSDVDVLVPSRKAIQFPRMVTHHFRWPDGKFRSLSRSSPRSQAPRAQPSSLCWSTSSCLR